MAADNKKLLLAFPRGFCAGVTRAVQIVEQALEKFGAPIYVRHEIVHNSFVNESLRAKGVVFVDDPEEVEPESVLIISAHGAAPEIHEICQKRKLHFIDATCPLVNRVHKLAKHYALRGFNVILIGHANHVEVIGTCGVAKEKTIVVENVDQARNIHLSNPAACVLLAQTTLSTDEVREISGVIKQKYPELVDQHSSVCYATTNRQKALKAVCEQVEFIYVVGSHNSSNSNRLVEVALKCGKKARLVERESEIREEELHNCNAVGLTAGASTPEVVVNNCVERLVSFGYRDFSELRDSCEELSFALPPI
jgi:4-hydroxy-3-methylbut-2-enyl diphosphate reductase